MLEIEITPNRPDCLSVLGVARELSALTGARLRPPKIAPRESRDSARSLAKIRVEAPELCARYTLRVISGLRVGPSPAWMAARLRACGLRPISNVVDVTNYVLWELGHPLHAFDAGRVTDATIVVRRAAAGERFTTLDGQARTLDASMLVIADPERAIGLAGVMGGQNSEVSAGTTRVLLESAYFDPGSIRRTSRALSLRTDAAYRFERGADIEGLLDANDRAAQLMAELAGGAVARGLLDAYRAGASPCACGCAWSAWSVCWAWRRSGARAADPTGLGTRCASGAILEVEVPSFRRDLAMEDDLAEEIIRVWGYDKIPSTLPGGQTVEVARESDRLRQEDLLRRTLAGAGLLETVTSSFTDRARNDALGAGEPLSLLNPLSQDAAYLRAHPLDGILGVVATNARRQQGELRVFEIGKTYEASADGDTATREPRWLALAVSGTRGEPSWRDGGGAGDVYDAKGLAEHALGALGVRTSTRTGGALGGFEPDCHASLVTAAGEVVAEFGEVAAGTRAALGIDAPVFAAAVRLDPLPWSRTFERYQALPRFPSVERDMAFLVPDPGPSAAAVETAIRREAGRCCARWPCSTSSLARRTA